MNRLCMLLVIMCGCSGSGALEETEVHQDLSNGNCRYDPATDTCKCIGSPIVLSVDGGPIQLTSSQAGVQFRLRNHQLGLWSWTAAGSKAAWLVLDVNHNGKIDDGSEMFGDSTLQATSADPNGFIALRLYDVNHDGKITPEDDVWDQLRLWLDDNHDGVSQPEELHRLGKFGVRELSTNFYTDGTVDQYGNQFRVAAPVVADTPVGPVAYDVWLNSISPVIEPTTRGGATTNSTQWLCAGLMLRTGLQSSPLTAPCFALTEPTHCFTTNTGTLSCLTQVVRYGQGARIEDATAQMSVAMAATFYTGGVPLQQCPQVHHGLAPGETDPLPFPGGTQGSIFSAGVEVSYSCIQVEVAPDPGDGGGGTCGP